jgi:hypothetical protein
LRKLKMLVYSPAGASSEVCDACRAVRDRRRSIRNPTPVRLRDDRI